MKRRDPGAQEVAYGVPCFPFSDALPFLIDRNEKDFSLALEMTVWESYAGTWLSLLPMEGGAPKGRRLAHTAE